MESVYQNSVSEFDLNLFEHGTSAYQANPTPCPEAKNLMIYRIKRRIKGTSKVIQRAKVSNDVLKVKLKELQETKAELEDTKKALFEKNEELKDSCTARNSYYNKAAKYERDLQIARDQLKHYEEKHYDFETQNRVTALHIDQIRALENIITEKEQNAVERPVKQANRKKDLLEKKLVRVLSEYIGPTIKKRDKWLKTLMKKYVPSEKCDNDSIQDLSDHADDPPFDDANFMSPDSPEQKDEEHQKIHEFSETTTSHIKPEETVLNSAEPPANRINRNTSLDFDYIESVDTGRGSSIGFSDGEKSFHSPDYYINDSPLSAVPRICNKCNVPKIDVCTSPIRQEISDISDSSASGKCKSCTSISKKDVGTNPTPLIMLDVATDTADILYEKYHIAKVDVATSPHKVCNSSNTAYDFKKTDVIQKNVIVPKTDITATYVPQEAAAKDHNTNTKAQSLILQFKLLNDMTASTMNKVTSPNQNLTSFPVDERESHINDTSPELPYCPVNLRDLTPNTAEIASNATMITSPVTDTPDTVSDYEHKTTATHINQSNNNISDHVATKIQLMPPYSAKIVSAIQHEEDVEVSATHDNISGKESPSSAKFLHNVTQNTTEIVNNIIIKASEVEDSISIPEDEPKASATHIHISSNELWKPPPKLRYNMLQNTEKTTTIISKLAEEKEEESQKSSGKLLQHHFLLDNAGMTSEIDRITSPVKAMTIISDDDYEEAGCSNEISQVEDLVLTSDDDNEEIATTPTSSQLSDFVISEATKLNKYVGKLDTLIENINDISSINNDETDAPCNSYTNTDLPFSPTTLRNITPNTELDISKKKLKEKECLELNNSNNVSMDDGSNIEIQSILNNMRLRVSIVSPIPATPPRYITGSIRNSSRQNELLRCQRLKKEILKIVHRFKNCIARLERSTDIISPEVDDIDDVNSNRRTSLEIAQELLSDEDICNELSDKRQFGTHNVDMRLVSTSETIRPESENIEDADCNMSNTDSNNVHNSFESEQELVSDEDIENELSESTQAGMRYVDMLQYDTETEELDQITSNESNNNNVCVKQSSKNKLSKIKSPKNIIMKQCFEATHEDNSVYGKRSANINISDENIKQSCVSITHLDSTLNTTDSGYNNGNNASSKQNISESNELEQICTKSTNSKKEHNTMLPSNNDVPNKIKNVRKITKLEKLRLKMVPRSKISKEVITRPKKKPQFKPIQINNKPKKRITESDTAATLNDKSVYDNAVKIVAAIQSNKTDSKEVRVIVEDCLIKMTSNKSPNCNYQNDNVSKLKSPPKSLKANKTKRKLLSELENVAKKQPKRTSIDGFVPVNCKRVRSSRDSQTCDGILPSLCSNESLLCNETKRSNCSNEISGAVSNKPETIEDSNGYIIKNDSKPPRENRTITLGSPPNVNFSKNEDSEALTIKKSSNSRRQSIYSNTDTKIVSDVVSEMSVAKKRRIANRRDSDNKLNNNNVIEKNYDVTFKTNSNLPSKNNGISNSLSTRNNQIKHENWCDTSLSPQRILRSSYVKRSLENNLETLPCSPPLRCSERNKFEKPNSVIPVSTRRTSERNNIELPNSDMTKSTQRRSSESTNTDFANPGMPLLTRQSTERSMNNLTNAIPEPVSQKHTERAISYADLGLFDDEYYDKEQYTNKHCDQEQYTNTEKPANTYKNNMLCNMIEKFGVKNFKKRTAKKVPESKVNEIWNKLETSITDIIGLPNNDECKGAMKRLVTHIRTWDVKHFLVGLMAYLSDHTRKLELFSKIISPPAPPMTKQEQVLLYVIDDLQNCYEYRGIVQKILKHIEYALFALNNSPHFDVLESMSHFYALLCRKHQKMSKLRLFIVDAMYCLQFKSLVLIKQCLEVWAFVLPLAHMGLAKTPLVICLIYLLHFYKFEDKCNRIEDMRFILRRKYSFELSDWNETMILDVFKTAIIEVRDNPLEMKMLRLALLILAKRSGANWCHSNLVKKLLQPMIEDESTSDVAKRFSVSVLGPLLKPYPNNMKVHCEMVTDYLFSMLEQKQSQKMQEAIVSSLICFYKQSNRVDHFLFKWNPKQMSPEFKAVFIQYVRSKPVNQWKQILSKI